MGAPCSWSGTRCSRFTASATPKSGCSCARARRASARWRSNRCGCVRNFRAVPALVGFCNDAFTRLFPPRMTCAAVRSPTGRACPHARRRRRLQEFPQCRCGYFPISARARHRRLPNASPCCAALDPGSSWRCWCPPTRTRCRSSPRWSALGLPVLGVDLVPLRERMAVRDLVQLTRALSTWPTAPPGLRCCAPPGAGPSLRP